MIKKTRRITATFSEEQFNELQTMMREDKQTNLTYYFVYLMMQEKKNREGNKKRAVGRPRNDEKEVAWYPAPYDKNAPPYTMDDLEAYYTFRGEPVPIQGAPLTKEELKQWDL